MPEGPELRRSADFLSEVLKDRLLYEAQTGDSGRYTPAGRELDGLNDFKKVMHQHAQPLIEEVNVKGKFMWWKLRWANHPTRWYMWTTYGMAGQWSHDKSKWVAFKVKYGGDPLRWLYFNDIRHFGTIKFVEGDAKHQKKLASLGPDMLSDPPDDVTFAQRLLKRESRTLAEALMDQSCISGVGNYVKAESLYRARLSPHRVVSDLTVEEIKHLREMIVSVMKSSYEGGGATISTYANPDGSTGRAQRRFMVYNHDNDPMGNEVIREQTKDGRTSHWCPAIQK